MKEQKLNFSSLFKSRKIELYNSNIKTIKILSLYFMIALTIFAVMAKVTFPQSPNVVSKLYVVYAIMFTLMTGLFIYTRILEKKMNKSFKMARFLTYCSISTAMLFIIFINIFISRITVRPTFFLLFNIILPSLFILRRREFVLTQVSSAIIFVILSSVFRTTAFATDVYFALSSLIIGIPFNLVIYDIKMNDEYTKSIYLEEANLDELSGLPNRRAYYTKVDHIYKSTNHDSILLAIFDFDDFKLINDTKGHSYGDAVIRHIGGILKKFAEDNQLFISRIGGDEFVLIGLNLQRIKVTRVLEDLQLAIKELLIKVNESFGISIGAFYSDIPFKYTPEEVFVKADEALYYVKANEKGSIKVIHNGTSPNTL